MSLLNDVAVEVQIGIDLIRSWQSHVLAVLTVEDCDGEGVREYTVVEVKARPSGGLVEGLEVLRVVEELEKGLHLVTVLLVVRRVDGITAKHALPVQVQELLDDRLKD